MGNLKMLMMPNKMIKVRMTRIAAGFFKEERV